jgi:hypothetical protein
MIEDLIEGIACYCDTEKKMNALYEMQNAFSFASLASAIRKSDPSYYNSEMGRYKHMNIDDRINARTDVWDGEMPSRNSAEGRALTKKYLTKNKIGEIKSGNTFAKRYNKRVMDKYNSLSTQKSGAKYHYIKPHLLPIDEI